jgi:hypothetical protein
MFEPKKGHGTAVALSQSGAFLRLCGWECQALSWWRAWDGVGMGLVRVRRRSPQGLKPGVIVAPYAALKRRSSTVVRGLRHG